MSSSFSLFTPQSLLILAHHCYMLSPFILLSLFLSDSLSLSHSSSIYVRILVWKRVIIESITESKGSRKEAVILSESASRKEGNRKASNEATFFPILVSLSLSSLDTLPFTIHTLCDHCPSIMLLLTWLLLFSLDSSFFTQEQLWKERANAFFSRSPKSVESWE